ncbi:MAG TPA: aminotransferase class V-fold PLP-dependent enzyme [Actinomycetota bacterium]
MPSAHPLEPGPDEMRDMAARASAVLVEHIASLPDQPASSFEGIDELVAALREPAPEGGSEFAELLAQIGEAAVRGFNTAGPGYLAYIPGGGLWSAAVADFLATAFNRYVGVWNAAPVFVQMEWQTIRWLADAFGYPAESSGILTSGGSMSNFSAVVAARRAMLGDDVTGGVVYVTEQTHVSALKSAVLAGIPRANVRALPGDDLLRMDPVGLRAAIVDDRARGLRPFLVVASAGTTNTGAVDPIAAVADVASAEGLWLHVDAAYGGFFQLTERGRAAFAGVERADSITLDPHKGMFLPYGTGSLLVRDGRRLREAHDVHEAEYLQDLAEHETTPNFSDLSPELSRDFRGLRVWLPLKLHGLAAFREALDEKLDLARVLYEGIREAPGIEIPWEPELSVVAFRMGAEDDTRALLDRINASRRIFLSSTMVGGRMFLRACVVSHRTHRDRIDEAVGIIRDSAAEVAGAAPRATGSPP